MVTPKMLGRAPHLKIHITQEIIDAGIERNSGHCIFAESIKVAEPDAGYVSVDIQTMRFSKDGRRYTYLTPRAVQEAIVNYDQGTKPEPFSFWLRSGQVSRSGKGKRTFMRARNSSGPGGTGICVPEISGGKPPPRSTGVRREFGLRARVR